MDFRLELMQNNYFATALKVKTVPKLLICDTAAEIKRAAGTDQFEQAFIRIVKEGAK